MLVRRFPRSLVEPLAFVFVLALALCAGASAQTPQGSATPEAARKIFESTCAACHGLDGQGGERGPNIATRLEVVRLSDDEILKVLREGLPASGMPAFASLGKAKLSSLLTYLRGLQGKGSSASIPGDPNKGKLLFYGSARCSECHIIHGNGGFLSTDLSNYAATVSALEIRSAITNPSGEASQRRSLVTVTLRDGKFIEGVVRNEDNFSLQLQSTDGTFHLLQKSAVVTITPHPEPLMPSDYASTLSAAQLNDLVGYLMTVARQTKKPASSGWQEEDDD